MLPPEVLEQARAELLDWGGGGMSVMEVSHRGREFVRVAAEAEADLRELMGVPRNYRVLFMQGGATRAVLAGAAESHRAGRSRRLRRHRTLVEEGDRRGAALLHGARRGAGPARRCACRRSPSSSFAPGAAYVHYTPNETISGVEFHYVPETGGVPLVADMSSNILSRPIDVSRFGADLCRRAEEHRARRGSPW